MNEDIENSMKVCKMFYKNKCFECPLRPECSGVKSPGKEGLEKWKQAVECKAKIILKNTEG